MSDRDDACGFVDALSEEARAILETRLRQYFDEANGCWTWTGPRTPKGYGHFTFDGRSTTAHRWVYELLVGAIAPGLHLDHRCQNPGCVNPAHMEPVTPAENRRRQVMRRGMQHHNGRKTHCPAGHAYDGDNVMWFTDSLGHVHRRCRECKRTRQRDRRVAAR